MTEKKQEKKKSAAKPPEAGGKPAPAKKDKPTKAKPQKEASGPSAAALAQAAKYGVDLIKEGNSWKGRIHEIDNCEVVGDSLESVKEELRLKVAYALDALSGQSWPTPGGFAKKLVDDVNKGRLPPKHVRKAYGRQMRASGGA